MTRKVISTERAPRAIGAYSQAIQVNRTLYLSGQIPLDPATGELVAGDMDAQVRRAFDNLEAVAEAAGARLADAVKLTIYVVDLKHFALVNQIMAEYFTEPYPARATVQVTALPKSAQFEVDCVIETSGA